MTIYYIDPDNGNDGNDGLTTVTAWQGKANQGTPVSGDHVLFKRGTTFRELIDAPSTGVTFGAYGTGAKPILSGADIQTGWAENATNQWEVSLAADPQQVFFDDVRGTKETVLGNVNSPNDWHWAGGTLTVFSVGSPTATIEASVRDYCFREGAADNLAFYDLVFKHSRTDGLGLFSQSGMTVVRCEAKSNWRHGFKAQSISGLLTFTSCMATDNDNGFSVDTSNGLTMDNCSSFNNLQLGGDGANLNQCDGFTVKNCKFYGNNSDGSADGLQVPDSQNFTIQSCMFWDNANADVILSTASQGSIQSCTFGRSDQSDTPSYHCFLRVAAGATDVSDCTFQGSPVTSACRLETLAGTFTHSGNTYKNATSISWSVANGLTLGNITSSGNKYINAKTRPQDDLIFYGGTTYEGEDLDTYVGASGQDATAVADALNSDA